MTQMREYPEVRNLFFQEIHEHPENIDTIMRNFAFVFFKGVRWPDSMDAERIGVTIYSTLDEGWKRYVLALARRR